MAKNDKSAAQQEQSQSPDFRALADRASTWMDADWVRPSQAERYAELLGDNPLDTLGVSLDDAQAYAMKRKAVPTELKERVREQYGHLKPSYQWLKGYIATAVALATDDLGPCPDNPDKRRQTERKAAMERLGISESQS